MPLKTISEHSKVEKTITNLRSIDGISGLAWSEDELANLMRYLGETVSSYGMKMPRNQSWWKIVRNTSVHQIKSVVNNLREWNSSDTLAQSPTKIDPNQFLSMCWQQAQWHDWNRYGKYKKPILKNTEIFICFHLAISPVCVRVQ